MITNESTAQRRLAAHQPFHRQPETILAEEVIIVERKKFTVRRCMNERGPLIRISEEPATPNPSGPPPRRLSIVIPLGGVGKFAQALARVCAQ